MIHIGRLIRHQRPLKLSSLLSGEHDLTI